MWLSRFFRRRRKQQARPIGEAEAYARSYGEPSPDVRVIKLPPRRPRDRAVLESGEAIRRAFLDRLDRRRGGRSERSPPDE
jgi:hypothetical protein